MKVNPAFSRTMALVAPVTVLTISDATGASDAFIKIQDIKGESTDYAKHKDWIEIQSFSWGVSNAGTFSNGGGGGAGKVSVQDLSFTKKLDKSSPLLMLACATGQHIPSVRFTVARPVAGQAGEPDTTEDYYVITLENVLVSSFTSSSSTTSGDRPMESLSLNFTKISFEYKPLDSTSPPVIVTHNFDQAPPTP